MLILTVFASPLVPRVEEWGPAAAHSPFVGMSRILLLLECRPGLPGITQAGAKAGLQL